MTPLYHSMAGEKPIRLLEVKLGNANQPVLCSLVHTHLKDIQGQYDAVSYTWGDAQPEHGIFINGTSLQTRPSVFQILNRFRPHDQSRLLWIDQLCINQDDLQERAQQVSFMHEIYKAARSVLIWLGEEDSNSKRVMGYISGLDAEKYLAESYDFQRNGKVSEGWTKKSTIFDKLDPSPDNRLLIEDVVTLLSRPWFSRIWIQQEAALHHETFVFCGEESVHWDQISALAWLLRPRGSTSWPDWVHDLFPNFEPKARAVWCLQSSRHAIRDYNGITLAYQLHELVQDTWMCLATDPRDKIFALRNLATDLKYDDWAPVVDYTICWEDVYTDMELRFLKRGKINTLLCAGRVNQQPSSHLPSWVPDWRAWPGNFYGPPISWMAGSVREVTCKSGSLPKRDQRFLRPTSFFAKKAPSKPKLAARSYVSLACIMEDSISFLSGVAENMFSYDGSLKTGRICDSSQRLLELNQSCRDYLRNHPHQRYMTGQSISDAYRATLITNTTHTTELATPEYYSKYDEWHSWLSAGADPSVEPIYEAAIEDSNTFFRQQFCVTSHGYLCLVPKMTEENDVVSILKGLFLPVVLRPREKYYEFIGNCYVHGMMENQAFFLIDEFGLKVGGAGDIKELPRDSRSLNLKDDRLIVEDNEGEDYSRIVTTLGVRWVDLI